jgi:hypothetical protein
MILSNTDRFVFRGTTIDYEGSKNSIALSYTSTSTHPVKALWFALECYRKFPDNSVVYVADRQRLVNLATSSNLLKDYEDEIAYRTIPRNFYPLCEGYLHVVDLQNIMRNLGIECNKIIGIDNLTRICKETSSLSVNDMETLLECILPNLKK